MIGLQDTSSETFRQLMGNGLTYVIPKFQRDYSWDIEQWDDLWQDIESIRTGMDEAHYMGYLVLQTSDRKNFRVIDGQQRLTTLSILILAVLKALKKLEDENVEADDNGRRRESLHNSYIGYLNPVTLVADNKLRLNRNNDDFYRRYLTTLERLPGRGLNSSEKLMRNCSTWFEKKLSEQFETGSALASFVDTIVDKLFFTVITVSDELNAFRVFETLNARGVRLSSADLLKNYLFSIVDGAGSHSSEILELEALWSKVISKLGSEQFPEFLRIFWNSRNKTTRQNDLFKTIRKNVGDKHAAFKLIRELNEHADLYIALLNPEDEFWNGSPTIQKYLRELKIFSVKQPLSLLLAAYAKLNQQRFEQLLKICTVVSFRYNVVGGLNPNDQEKTYNNISLKLNRDESFSFGDFQNVYPTDEGFEPSFCNKEFKPTTRNHAIVRYILGRIEDYAFNNPVNAQSERYSVEHILPENPGVEWEHVPNDAFERMVYRLGNLTLLEKNLNKDIGNTGFTTKMRAYQKSSFRITRQIAEEYAEWNEEHVSQRQFWLAKQAKAIWKIN